MTLTTERNRNIISGAVGLAIVISLITIGIKASFGAFDTGYELQGTFAAAGQGLISGSDVKIRGVNVGEVKSIELVENQALIKLRIENDTQVPVTAQAVIRPKTLFGEKFVDIVPGPTETTGPYLDDGDRIEDTQGGFELEKVLADTYPLLKAVDPAELMTVLGEMADAGDGLGETINRTIVNSSELAESFAGNADEPRQFLQSFAEVSDELAASAEDLLGIADAGNQVLPTLNDREGDIVDLLQQTGRLSNDVADLLEANRPFVDAALVDGSRSLQVLYDQRSQVVPLVTGLRTYLQTLSSVIRIEIGDGTLMAAVKAIMGGDLCGVLPCPGTEPSEPAAAPAPPPLLPTLPTLPPLVPDVPLDDPLDLGTGGTTDDGGLGGLLGRVFGG